MGKMRLVAALIAVTIAVIYVVLRREQPSLVAEQPKQAAARVVEQHEMAAADAVARAAAAAKRVADRASATHAPLSSAERALRVAPNSVDRAQPPTTPSGLPTVLGPQWADGKFADFTPDELADMATRCELRWQLPATPDDRYVAAVRSLYVELTGDAGGAAHASLRTMADTLRVDSDDDATEVHRRLSARRAGDRVDLSGSVYERYLQLQLDESERAHRDGVPLGAKLTVTGCVASESLFRSTR